MYFSSTETSLNTYRVFAYRFLPFKLYFTYYELIVQLNPMSTSMCVCTLREGSLQNVRRTVIIAFDVTCPSSKVKYYIVTDFVFLPQKGIRAKTIKFLRRARVVGICKRICRPRGHTHTGRVQALMCLQLPCDLNGRLERVSTSMDGMKNGHLFLIPEAFSRAHNSSFGKDRS